ncbi:glycosyltransferase [Jannaschia formosa]|uniref:glycosyltransferase n=1 Tax=Jannaschia formosa TaxID=2259592 RepID=UPI000E1BCF44|nr:glycosyltransferase [Jannaschia formosa]TFL17105.1 glycosyltransferase [Jannaschia formosa]
MAHVRILMATRNGVRHLDAQLASILAQDHGDWSLRVSDDGSQDGTRQRLADWAAAHPGREVRVSEGPGRGAAANFLSLIREAGDGGAWLALSDQDDVWHPDRLTRALSMLGRGAGAGVYCSRTVLVDEAGRPLRESRRHPRGLGFGNALVQNVMAGNTMVIEPVMARVLGRTAGAALAARNGAGVAHHDWWIYLLASGIGARLIHDDRPGLDYRQHGANEMGASDGLRRAGARLGMLTDGRWSDWIGGNLEALEAVAGRLTPEARALADRFRAWRAGEGRFADLYRAGVRRQTRAGDAVLWAMAATGRLRA